MAAGEKTARFTEFGSHALPRLRILARSVAIGAFAGILAGAIAGGLGSRLAMRIIALANKDNFGLITENGNIVGDVTLEGTVDLLFAGAFLGFFAGLLYILIRRWLPGRGLWKGLSYGLLLFLVINRSLIDPDNRDFHVLDPPLLSVALFSLLFPLFGLVLAPIVERLDRYVPPLFYGRVATAIGYIVLAGLSIFGLITFGRGVGEIL